MHRAVGFVQEHGKSAVEVRDSLARVVVAAQESSAVRRSLEGDGVEQGEQPVAVNRKSGLVCELAEEVDPAVDIGCAVVAVNHCYRGSRRGCDHVDFPVDAELAVGDDHCKVAGSGADVSGVQAHGIGCNHACSGIALRRGNGNTCLQDSAGIEESGTGFGKLSGFLACNQDFREDLADIQSREGLELVGHLGIEVVCAAVDGEHARCIVHADVVLTRQDAVHEGCKGFHVGDLRNMGFLVQYCLIEV